jgi:hypothetical protein
MRLRSDIWVQAYLRQIQSKGAFGYVLRRGDPDAGAILIRVSSKSGTSLYIPTQGIDLDLNDRLWRTHISAVEGSEAKIDAYSDRQIFIDPDIWIVEIEDREGRNFLQDSLEDD